MNKHSIIITKLHKLMYKAYSSSAECTTTNNTETETLPKHKLVNFVAMVTAEVKYRQRTSYHYKDRVLCHNG